MIILAHVDPAPWLFQLRNFDVPLMVLVSGMSFALSYSDGMTYKDYVWKRVKRLLFPVWIFLSFYFVALWFFSPDSRELNLRTIATSFGLVSGIGYVWIIRVFLMVALVAPFLLNWHRKDRTAMKYYSAMLFAWLLYEMLRYISLPYGKNGLGQLISLVCLYVIPYSLVFLLGVKMLAMKKVHLYTLGALCLLVFASVAAVLYFDSGRFVATQELKYPPSIYYFSYAIFVATSLWLCATKIVAFLRRLKLGALVSFVSNNSIWIYLWHIPFIKLISTDYLVKYFVVFGLAVFVAFVQKRLVDTYVLPSLKSPQTKSNVKLMLTG
ncbi:hypothetical protein A3765_15055 [Oleiphilus sp. HI0130]|nr:hypothetical protein A3765_15055 [Oleiphilus sp. HI0130]